ncbi:hypothetical protein K435DRAFT_775943 [Dendrothele bispora CBS 962.96]|uniref:Mini-chromosome maintenance complex-binding protein n=1 Tax=Dendrothele bispora (strain CBS 962.96) TaxID=1314807 RepID=A0A4S8MHT2_DENBC|nr:hypothetical protein K435DRAFT_775943 [Dendrothele bispora CBS 962.96]
MVSALPFDVIADPSTELQRLFDQDSSDSFPARVADHFSSIFADPIVFDKIPPVDLNNPPESFKDRALIRFRAMVQDTSASPEMYLAEAGGHKYGGWGVVYDAPDEIDYDNLRECSVFWAVSIPGESDWIHEGQAQPISSAQAPSQPHKYPHPNIAHVGIQLKIYNPSVAETLKSTDTATFVGLITSEPRDLDTHASDAVPTLHVLFHRPHPITILPYTFPLPSPRESISGLRRELIEWIAREALADDIDAAEWVLLCCLARVQSRTPPILPPSLTLSRFPSPPTPSLCTPVLCAVITHLFPAVTLLPLSLGTINDSCFMPESREEDLHSGWLQLPRGSICLVTESGVTEGDINEKGVLNLRATQEIMTHQVLDYVFPYSSFKFETDIAWIVLSEGHKSAFFQTHISIPLKMTNEISDTGVKERLFKPKDEITLPPQDKLEMFRSLVGGAKIGLVGVSEDAAEFIQEDFVEERRTSNIASTSASKPHSKITADDLIRRMTMAKLLALSLHETEVTVDIWNRMKELDARRTSRLD